MRRSQPVPDSKLMTSMSDIRLRSEPEGVIPQARPTRLEMVNLRPPPAPPAPPMHEWLAHEVSSAWRRNWLLICVVLVPTLLAAVYFSSLAHDRYAAEARFVIRSSGLALNPTVGTMIAPGGLSRSMEDAHAINSYLESIAALADLGEQLDVELMFSKASADPLWRYPPFFKAQTNEALYARYQRHVSIEFDKTTGITTLTVQAFTADDSLQIANALLRNAESLLNRLGSRARNDATSAASTELFRAREKLAAAQDAISAFRNREQMIDPTRISNSVVDTITALSLEIAESNAQLKGLQNTARRSPQVAALQTRISALQQQVEIERARLAGSDAGLAQTIAEYERLLLEKSFSDRMLVAAVNSADNARLDQQRQQFYVERVVSPSLADAPFAPKRWIMFFATVAVLIGVYAALRKLTVSRFEPH
jgi:capsular polysaccharide transport system permease protein